ncbi:MAG: hypothetical protein J6M18_05830 [Actinomycetaceae bacterium]|nr:hypothetical protein [Actinomycetaceae bacterium]
MDFLYFLVGGLTGIALYIARNYDVIMKRIGTKKHVSTVLDMFLYVSYGLYFAFALGGISSSSLVMTELLVHKPFYVFLLAGICVAYMQKRKKVRGRI